MKSEADEIPTPTGIEAMVCADIADRQRLGIAKYGMTLEQNPADFKARLVHAYQESQDQTLYLKWAIEGIPPYLAELEAVARAVNGEVCIHERTLAKLTALKQKGWTP